MKTLAKMAAAAAILLGAGTISASAACNNDASTETVLGAGSGALVGGLATNSIGGALVGGVAGGVIGNVIGHSNNREDCRRAAARREYRRERVREQRGQETYYLDREGRRHYYYR
jgi:outer membrane lipoprotein SlyB